MKTEDFIPPTAICNPLQNLGGTKIRTGTSTAVGVRRFGVGEPDSARHATASESSEKQCCSRGGFRLEYDFSFALFLRRLRNSGTPHLTYEPSKATPPRPATRVQSIVTPLRTIASSRSTVIPLWSLNRVPATVPSQAWMSVTADAMSVDKQT